MKVNMKIANNVEKKVLKNIKNKEERVLEEFEKTEDLFQRFWFRFFLVICFVIAMAFLEATVVVYLREMYALHYIIPENAELALKLPYFSLIKNPLTVVPSLKILIIELFREAATMVMLLGFAFLVGRKWRERLAVFLVSFALWDIFYYVFLNLLIGWPPSLATMDILFLIPLPWLAPVWLPVTISLGMIVTAFFLFRWQLQINHQKIK